MSIPGAELSRRERRERVRYLESRGLPLTEEAILGLSEQELATERSIREQSAVQDTQAFDPTSLASFTPEQQFVPGPIHAVGDQSILDTDRKTSTAPLDDLDHQLEQPTGEVNTPAPVPVMTRRERRLLEQAGVTQSAPDERSGDSNNGSVEAGVATDGLQESSSSNPLFETGGVPRWSDALEMPRDVDPHEIRPGSAEDEPVATVAVPSQTGVTVDSSQLILSEIPELATGQAEIVVTGSIVLPSVLEADQAEPQNVGTADPDDVSGVVTDTPQTGMSPVAAATAVSWNSEAPEMVREEETASPKPSTIFLWVAASLTGIALIALGVAAILRQF